MTDVKDRDSQISFDAVIERIAPEVPRYIVYPGEAWDESSTFIVEVALNGIPIGLRNLIPWKERGWHFGLSEPICRKVRVDTGDRVHVEMRRLGDTRPRELEELLENNGKARKAWDSLPDGERRDFVLFVADAKKPETRIRRARRLFAR
jgi:Bacteriocin-protection, YdeI or OmpD-Associated